MLVELRIIDNKSKICFLLVRMLYIIVLFSIDGCHNDCHGHGVCQQYQNGWRCGCRDGWKGQDCSTAMEIQCDDKNDNDDGKITFF